MAADSAEVEERVGHPAASAERQGLGELQE